MSLMLASYFHYVFQYNRCENITTKHVYTVHNYRVYLNIRQFIPYLTSKKSGEGSLIIGQAVKLVLYTYQRLSRGRASCRYLGKDTITIVSESSHTNTVSAG